jgi:hypothetical protein
MRDRRDETPEERRREGATDDMSFESNFEKWRVPPRRRDVMRREGSEEEVGLKEWGEVKKVEMWRRAEVEERWRGGVEEEEVEVEEAENDAVDEEELAQDVVSKSSPSTPDDDMIPSTLDAVRLCLLVAAVPSPPLTFFCDVFLLPPPPSTSPPSPSSPSPSPSPSYPPPFLQQ